MGKKGMGREGGLDVGRKVDDAFYAEAPFGVSAGKKVKGMDGRVCFGYIYGICVGSCKALDRDGLGGGGGKRMSLLMKIEQKKARRK